MATNSVERPAKRAKLLEDSDSSDGEDGGVSLSINKEYAKRYEYNEKRKEKEKCMMSHYRIIELCIDTTQWKQSMAKAK